MAKTVKKNNYLAVRCQCFNQHLSYSSSKLESWICLVTTAQFSKAYPAGNEETYPHVGKAGKSALQKCRLVADMLVPWRVYLIYRISTTISFSYTLYIDHCFGFAFHFRCLFPLLIGPEVNKQRRLEKGMVVSGDLFRNNSKIHELRQFRHFIHK